MNTLGGAAVLDFRNCSWKLAGLMSNRVSAMTFYNTTIVGSANAGAKYFVGNNSVIEMGGNEPPGDTPGGEWLGGLYSP